MENIIGTAVKWRSEVSIAQQEKAEQFIVTFRKTMTLSNSQLYLLTRYIQALHHLYFEKKINHTSLACTHLSNNRSEIR